MNTALIAEPNEKIVTLALQPKPKPQQRKQRFKITEFRNPSGAVAFRVSGCDRDGKQIRENFKDEPGARCRQIELETEYLQGQSETTIRATKLSDEQLRVAEIAIRRMGDNWERLPDAADHWNKASAAKTPSESPLIDKAVDDYLKWVATSDLRDTTKKHFRNRVTVFKNSVPNARVSEMTPDEIWAFMDGLKITDGGKRAYRGAVSSFFSWCMERPRRWVNFNPCKGVTMKKQPRNGQPDILSLADCKAIMAAAEAHKGGMLTPYLATCLFAGLRPTEAARLEWAQVNFDDGEISLRDDQTKTNKARVVKICPTLAAWLKAHKDKSFFPANWRKEFDAVRAAAGLREWTPDVLRHTAISHYFRKTGSYGFTAEQFGNSEAIIKNHYQGRVSSDDTNAFYQIMPGK